AAVTGAVLLGDAVTLRLLLEHRANAIRTIATKAPHTEWALTLAADAGCLSSVQILLQFGANPTPSDVYVAAQRGRPDLVRVLVAVNPLKLSMPPLELAMRRGDAEIVSTLLDSGIEPGIVGLAFAVESGSVEVVRKLLIHTSDTMVATASGTPRSPAAGVVMARAIRDGRLMDVKTLTEAGLSVTSADIYMAARTGSVVIVAVLLSHCRLASTEEIDIGVTPLNLAVKEGDIVAVRTLTRCGVVPSRFALAAAVGSGREDILRILGACSATTAEHSTAVAGSPNSDAAHERDDLMHSFALNLAVDIGRANVVRTLLEIFPRMHVSLAVVMLAARRGDLDVIMSLLWRFEGSVNDLQQLSKEAETHQHLLAATVLDSLARSLSERS
ncbi:ankyrin repeat-containing domain protein, partial [Zopfochytrium polystomum]